MPILNLSFSVAANVANTRNIVIKPMEYPSNNNETSEKKPSENHVKHSDLQNTHNLVVPVEGDLVLHKEENYYNGDRRKQSQEISNDDGIDEYHHAESICLVNVDRLRKSGTIETHLSSVEEEDISTDKDIMNDDGKTTHLK